MVAGINGASNSKANKKKTTDVAWSPAPPKKEKKPGLAQTLNQQRKYKNYRTSGGDLPFPEWLKTQ